MGILLSVHPNVRVSQPHVEIRPANAAPSTSNRSAGRSRYIAIDAIVSLTAMAGFVAATLAAVANPGQVRDRETSSNAQHNSSALSCARPAAVGATSL